MTTTKLLEKLERQLKDTENAIALIKQITIGNKREAIVKSVKGRKWSKEQRAKFMKTIRRLKNTKE